MFGLGKDDDDQRMWNLLIFHAPLTDKEIEDLPFGCIFVVLVSLILLVLIFG